jgi:hypothetical protein
MLRRIIGLAHQIFISYRWEDSAGHAGRLFVALKDEFGEKEVFFDVEAESEAKKLAQRTLEVLRTVAVLVAVIGKRWIDATDRHGNRRLCEIHSPGG